MNEGVKVKKNDKVKEENEKKRYITVKEYRLFGRNFFLTLSAKGIVYQIKKENGEDNREQD